MCLLTVLRMVTIALSPSAAASWPASPTPRECKCCYFWQHSPLNTYLTAVYVSRRESASYCSKIDSHRPKNRQWRANFGERANGLFNGQSPEQSSTAASRGCFNPLPVITSHIDLTPPNRAVCSQLLISCLMIMGGSCRF